jgi:small multidrug resistance pump
MNMTLIESWVCLAIAILFSVFGTVSMKLSHGLRKLKPTLWLAIFYIIAFVAMTFALKYIELSTLYAVWSGVGTILVALAGVLYFNESVSLKKMIFLILIVIGIIGLHFGDFA